MTAAIAAIAALLQRHLGLASGSIGTRVIESAIHRRMTATGLIDPATYAAAVTADRHELDELVEAVVVPETWFFRYLESFRHLTRWATNRTPKPSRAHPLRVLSAPCATGEEPYSIAVSLLDAGFANDEFRVEAVDVSKRAIDYAIGASYGANAFREQGIVPADRHFPRVGKDYRIADPVRRSVSFRVANLADPETLAGHHPFDAVFCRNLFIYLTPEAKRTVIATIERLLAPGGVIYMGHAEPLGLIDPCYKSVPPPQAFAFARGAAADAARVTAGDFLSLPLGPGQVLLPPKSSRLPRAAVWSAPAAVLPIPKPLTKPLGLLERARGAADRGATTEAADLCQQALTTEGPSADGYALLGTIHLTAGRPADAERAFTQALYLHPNHYDALLHLLILAENRKDATGAANYRRRLDAVGRKDGGR